METHCQGLQPLRTRFLSLSHNSLCWAEAFTLYLPHSGPCSDLLVETSCPLFSCESFSNTGASHHVGPESDDSELLGLNCVSLKLTHWCPHSKRQWWMEKPGLLQSLGLQRVGHDFVAEQQQPNTSECDCTFRWSLDRGNNLKWGY